MCSVKLCIKFTLLMTMEIGVKHILLEFLESIRIDVCCLIHVVLTLNIF